MLAAASGRFLMNAVPSSTDIYFLGNQTNITVRTKKKVKEKKVRCQSQGSLTAINNILSRSFHQDKITNEQS